MNQLGHGRSEEPHRSAIDRCSAARGERRPPAGDQPVGGVAALAVEVGDPVDTEREVAGREPQRAPRVARRYRRIGRGRQPARLADLERAPERMQPDQPGAARDREPEDVEAGSPMAHRPPRQRGAGDRDDERGDPDPQPRLVVEGDDEDRDHGRNSEQDTEDCRAEPGAGGDERPGVAPRGEHGDHGPGREGDEQRPGAVIQQAEHGQCTGHPAHHDRPP